MDEDEVDYEFLTQETVQAGNKQYKTDRLLVYPPDGSDPTEINHIDHECPECAAIEELAIELQTESLVCPICDYRKRFDPAAHLAAGIDIDDQPPAAF